MPTMDTKMSKFVLRETVKQKNKRIDANLKKIAKHPRRNNKFADGVTGGRKEKEGISKHFVQGIHL